MPFFKRDKIPTVRESLRVVAVMLHRANDLRQQQVKVAERHAELLGIIADTMGKGPGLDSHVEMAQSFNERWQPIIDKLMGNMNVPAPPATDAPRADDPPVSIEASGIRTTADPNA